jgi:superfamily I DNA/RNA helicase
MKKILLAGPGTGKTRKVKEQFLSTVKDFKKVLILSFTNATVNDLRDKFEKAGMPINERNCMTLHSYALRLNHKREMHVLNQEEEYILRSYAKSLEISFEWLCSLLDSITYEQMVVSLTEFADTNPAYLKEKIGEVEMLIVDEFQDFNDAEQILVHLIAKHAADTLILGDDDQAIYRFKDAKPDGIIKLYNDTSLPKIPHENECYRCPDEVIEKCTNLISCNKKRVPKVWKKRGKAGTVDFNQFTTIPETIQWVAEKIVEARKANPASSVLVLCPVRYGVEGLSKELEARGIPYEDFFKETVDPELVNLLWRLRLIYGTKKLLNFLLLFKTSKPKQHVWTRFKKLLKQHLNTDFTFPAMLSDIAKYLDDETISLLGSPPDFDELLKTEPWSKLAAMLEKVDGDSAEQKLERVFKYIDPPMFVNKENVNIMSIHKSKGLEAEHVFILGVVDGILPREAKGIEDIEDDRRVLFVGMSRTEVALHLVSTVRWKATDVYSLGTAKFAQHGRYYRNGRTSPFIKELKLPPKV